MSETERTGAERRPRLAAKVRLRWDKREQKYLLVYPERGMLLNASAGAILSKCDGVRSIEAIALELAEGADADGTTIRRDVETFLEEMQKRGVVELT
jgi:pyrroloquinoline quinone biosynthesis protein D